MLSGVAVTAVVLLVREQFLGAVELRALLYILLLCCARRLLGPGPHSVANSDSRRGCLVWVMGAAVRVQGATLFGMRMTSIGLQGVPVRARARVPASCGLILLCLHTTFLFLIIRTLADMEAYEQSTARLQGVSGARRRSNDPTPQLREGTRSGDARRMYVCMYVCVYVCMYVTYVCMHVCMCVDALTHHLPHDIYADDFFHNFFYLVTEVEQLEKLMH